jgi:hypothetical protein
MDQKYSTHEKIRNACNILIEKNLQEEAMREKVSGTLLQK